MPKVGATGPMPVVHSLGPQNLKEYEKVVEMFDDDEFVFRKMDIPELNGAIGEALKVVTLAGQGRDKEAKASIQRIRTSLKDEKPTVATEAESILKAAEAMISDPSQKGPPKSFQVIRGNPKWAEAFAFSMNKATRTLPGLIMVDQQIKSGNLEEAARALSLLESRPDLTESEKRSVARLKARLQTKKEAPPATTAVSGGE